MAAPERKRFGALEVGYGFLLYCLIGATGVGINLAVYVSVLSRWAVPLGASALAFCAALGWNFLLNWSLTFRNRRSRPWTHHFLGYALIALVTLGINLTGLSLLLDRFGPILGQLGGIALGSVWGYFANRWLNFRAVPSLAPGGPIGPEERPEHL